MLCQSKLHIDRSFYFDTRSQKSYKRGMPRSKLEQGPSSVELSCLKREFPKGIVAIDLETTGLSPLTDCIIEIAAVKVSSDGKIDYLHTLINPEITIPELTIKFHGIHDEDVADSPKIDTILPGLLEFIGDSDIVAHNALFDIGFLAKEIHLNNLAFSKNQVYDSCKLTRFLFKRLKVESKPANNRLSTLSDYFKIPLTHHQAMDDAMASLRILAKSLISAKENKIKNALEKSLLFQLDFFIKYKHQELSKEGKELLQIITDRDDNPTYIIYNGGTKGNHPRRIRPIGLLPWPKGPVLYAECLDSRINKSYLVKKIKKVMTQKQFEGKNND
jgi:DNA polymerase III subunit epsilon